MLVVIITPRPRFSPSIIIIIYITRTHRYYVEMVIVFNEQHNTVSIGGYLAILLCVPINLTNIVPIGNYSKYWSFLNSAEKKYSKTTYFHCHGHDVKGNIARNTDDVVPSQCVPKPEALSRPFFPFIYCSS